MPDEPIKAPARALNDYYWGGYGICPGCRKPVVGPRADQRLQVVPLGDGTTWHVDCALDHGKIEPVGRPSWEDVALGIAGVVASRSTCPRLRAGAVITTPDHRVLATGYNGAPYDQPHCTDVGCMVEGGHCVRAVHAEVNAVVQAAALGGPGIRGSTLYCTHRSCVRCAPILVQSGIARVVYAHEYDSDLSSGAVIDLLTRSNVRVEVRGSK